MGKKLLIALIALMLNLTCFSGVLFVSSYLISSDEAVNNFTVGDSKLKILEDFENPGKVTPGMVINKKVQVKNTGLCPCKIRTLVSFSDSNYQKYSRIDFNADKWEYKNDGYWYYKGVLNPGGKTPYLFEKVNISENAPTTDMKGFEIIVYSECVNTEAGGF